MKHYFADVCQKFLMLPVQLPSSRGYSCLNAFLPTQDLQLRNHFLAGVMAVSPLTELSSSLLGWSCRISDAEITLLCSTTKAAWVQQIEGKWKSFPPHLPRSPCWFTTAVDRAQTENWKGDCFTGKENEDLLESGEEGRQEEDCDRHSIFAIHHTIS